jgi:hypothetical protein
VRRWIYKTDEEGKPRRFLNHREAVWWAVLKVGKVLGLFVVSPILWAIFGPEAPDRWARASLAVAVVVVLWLVAAGAMYLFVALSGGVMARAERRRT